MERFIYLTEDKNIISKVKAGVVPGGYYDIQDNWCGDRWVTTYRYYEIFQETDDWGNPDSSVSWLDEFQPETCRISEAGPFLTAIVEES